MLRGGMDGWKDQILFPTIPEHATAEEMAGFEKIKSVSQFFGGTPQTDSATETLQKNIEMPKIEMPTQIQPIQHKRKKKKDGC